MKRAEGIWHRRRGEFWREAIGYWRYVGRSGFFGFVLLLLLAGSYFYGKALLALPADFPYMRIVVPIMLITLAVSPIRTFLREADRIFLLPMEDRMAAYFRSALIYSFVWQAAAVFLINLAIWPLYTQSRPDLQLSFAGFTLLLLLGKAGNLLAAREETRLQHALHRRLLAACRWLITGLFVYAAYAGSLKFAFLLLSALFLLAVFVIARTFPAFAVNWEFLIEREKKHRSRHYLFFSWFADVPHLGNSVQRRAWLAGITRLFSMRQENTYLYLYAKTFARTEIAVIVLRLALLGVLLMAVLPSDAARWAVYAVLLPIAGFQLAALEQHHRYTFWLQLYPVGGEQLSRAISRIVFGALLAVSLIVGAAMAASSKNPPASFAAGLAGLVYAYLYGVVAVKRKLRKKSLQA